MKAYITRDEDGCITLWEEKPSKDETFWVGSSAYRCVDVITDSDLYDGGELEDLLPSDVNPQLEDAEPVEVNLELKITST